MTYSRLQHALTTWKTLIVVMFVLFLYYYYLSTDDGSSETSSTTVTSRHSVSSIHDDTQIELTISLPPPSPELINWWNDFVPFLVAAKPDCSPVEILYGIPQEMTWDPRNKTKQRIDALSLSQAQLKSLKESHKAMAIYAKQQLPKLYYKRRTRGIVTTANSAYMSTLIVSLRILRQSGSKLPIEVFLNDGREYMRNRRYCEDVLPELNARCRLFSDVMAGAPFIIDIKSYQCKVFAMLFSSFEDLLFLDSDSFPVRNPDDFLFLDPFRWSGLVIWPDFWESTASQSFFDIASINAPPLFVRPSSESGQLLISKRTHSAALVLAAYYNYYGPNYYYPLLSQGGPGQGDKETFLHAAMALDLPFYDVKSKVSVLGHKTDDHFKGYAMVQVDPVEDYRVESYQRAAEPKGFFIHNNMCKLDPEKVFEPHCGLQDSTGNWLRLWSPQEAIFKQFGYDIERCVWQQVIITACEGDNTTGTCHAVENYYQKVFSS